MGGWGTSWQSQWRVNSDENTLREILKNLIKKKQICHSKLPNAGVINQRCGTSCLEPVSLPLDLMGKDSRRDLIVTTN